MRITTFKSNPMAAALLVSLASSLALFVLGIPYPWKAISGSKSTFNPKADDMNTWVAAEHTCVNDGHDLVLEFCGAADRLMATGILPFNCLEAKAS